MTRKVTGQLPEPVRDTPTRGVGHRASQADMRQSPTQKRPGGKGLVPGFVTGVPGIPRTRQLKIIGNGVVPQQAAVALRLLIGAAAIPAPPAGGTRAAA